MVTVQERASAADAKAAPTNGHAAQIAASSPMLDDALESAEAWVWEADSALRFSAILGPIERVSNLSAAELIGKPIKSAVYRPDDTRVHHYLDLLQAHRPFRDVVTAIKTRAAPRWIKASGRPIDDGAGVFQGYRGIAVDITEQMVSERSTFVAADHLINAIEFLPFSIVLCDAEDRIVLCNGATKRIVPKGGQMPVAGMRFEDLLRAHVASGLLPAAKADPERWIAERMAEHRSGNTNNIYNYNDGRWIQIIERRTRDGGIIGFRLDITEHKKREIELEQLGETLRESEEHLKHAQHISGVGSVERDLKTDVVKWSEECCRIFGYEAGRQPPSPNEFLALIHPDDRDKYKASMLASEQGRASDPLEFRVPQTDGSVRWIYCESSVRLDPNGKPTKRIAAYRDVTEERKTREALKSMAENLRHGQEVLALAQRAARMGSVERDILSGEVTWSEETYRIFGRDRHLHAPRRPEMLTLFHPEDAIKYETVMAASEEGAPVSNVLLRLVRPDGALRLLELNAIVLFDDDGVARRRISSYRDVTEERESRKALQAMAANLRRSREILAQAQRLARMGSDYRDFSNIGLSPEDLIEWSDMNYEIFGVDKKTFVATNENFLKLVHPDDRALVTRTWAEAAEGKVPAPFEYRVIRPDGALRYIYRETALTLDDNGKPLHMVGSIHDITEKRAAAEELRRKTLELEEANKELHRSNAELEQFAYVASHDLQEPLRMVASYCQLLQRRYKGNLGADADEFISYAVDGSRRMQRLINDLLSYSRVGRKGSDFETLDFTAVIDAALANLRAAIAENDATIEVADMPEIVGARPLLTQLVQNLIGNAIKFRRDGTPPIVRITASQEEAFWHIVVEDNGIGIERDYLDRVFLIFQRLHERDKYAGTGIGLAIAKKVIEYHGGRIWIDSTPGRGSRFHFTLPATA